MSRPPEQEPAVLKTLDINHQADRLIRKMPGYPIPTETSGPADYFAKLGDYINTRLIFDDHDFYPLLEILGAENRSIVRDMIAKKDFYRFHPYENEAEYRNLLWAARWKERLRHTIILKEFGRGNTLGLDQCQQVIATGFCQTADILDALEVRWRDDVVWSPVGRAMDKLSDEEKMVLPTKLKELGLAHPYAVLWTDLKEKKFDLKKIIKEGNKNGELYEIPYTQRYKEEYEALAERLSQVATDLINLPPDEAGVRDSYVNYLQKWIAFCQCQDKDELDKRGYDLDRAWMELKGVLIWMPPMEYSYYGTDKIRKDMACSLGIVDAAKASLLAACEEQKQQILGYFDQKLAARVGDFPVLVESLTLIPKLRFSSFVNIAEVMTHDFLPSMQVLPNFDRESLIYEMGRRILVYPEGAKKVWQKMLETWGKVFGHEALQDFEELSVDDWLIYYLAPHETGEAILRNSSSDQRLGGLRARLNEDKSQSAGFARLAEEAKAEKLSLTDAVKIAKLSMFYSILSLRARTSPHREPYYRYAVIQINLALKCGLLRYNKAENKVERDWSKSLAYLEEVAQHFWENHVHLWESEGEEAQGLGNKILTTLGQETEGIKAFISRI